MRKLFMEESMLNKNNVALFFISLLLALEKYSSSIVYMYPNYKRFLRIIQKLKTKLSETCLLSK